jgi:hypothetical protein
LSELVDALGRPVEDLGDIVTPGQYVDNVGSRAGLTKEQRDFIRKNRPDEATDPTRTEVKPEELSRSGRQIYALREMLLKAAFENLSLWGLLSAATQRAGGSMTFTQLELQKYLKPAQWAAVLRDGDDVVVKLGQFTKPAEVPVETPA